VSNASVGRISSLDASTLAKVQAGCNFVNAEVTRLRNRVFTIGIICGGGAAVLWMLMGAGDPRFPLVVAVLVWGYFANQARRELASSYKGIVVRRIVQSLGRGLSYKPVSSLSKQQFEAMDLFNESAHSWKSEDEVSGQKNAVKYALHEVQARRRERSNRGGFGWSSTGFVGLALTAAWIGRRGGRGGAADTRPIIFKGLVVKLDFNKNFQGHTVVVPDTEGQILGGLLGESRSRRKKEMVMLENPDFEKMFSVYSSNDQEARYLITPKLMELVMEAQALLGGQLRLCFSQNSLYVAVPQNEDRFEVALFGSPITPATALGDLVSVVNLAERLVETLDLETRIWTKV
jgi:hypothetical protein